MTTLPDTNVRLARHGAAGSARVAPDSVLARLLLRLADHVSKLDRKLFLLFVVSPLSACVIPAGPEFQDPAGVPNAPPYVVAASPERGSTVTGNENEVTFSVTVGDVNLDDTIWVKWITEYPPFNNNLSPDQGWLEIPPPADGSPTRSASTFTPGCTQVNQLVTTHIIMAAISDRRPTTGLLNTDSTIPPQEVFWFWQHACQMESP
jgi:hypothetical protein